MFRDHVQASRAIRLLLADETLDRLWRETGPTTAILYRYEKDLELPPIKQALLLAAWSLWTPLAPSVPFGDVVRSLDQRSCDDLCSLMIAYKGGADAVDDWIDTTAARRAEEAEPQPEEDFTSLFEGWPTLDELSARYARRALAHTSGNHTRAAALLGIDRRTIGRLVQTRRGR